MARRGSASWLWAAAIGLWLASAASPSRLLAEDPPHWLSTSVNIDCTSQCHVPHHAEGGALNPSASNVNLCQSCHRGAGLAGDLAINNSDKSVLGVDGYHHGFDVPATQDLDGDGTDDVLPPLDPEMSLRVFGGNIVCSTCHNQHKSDITQGGSFRISPAKRTTDLGSAGSPASGGTFTATDGFWYLIEIVVGGTLNNTKYCYSKDNGLSWFPAGCDPPGTTTPNFDANANGTGNPVDLADGVQATFGNANYVAGERWEFSASWPFLRAQLDNASTGSLMCLDCHRNWNVQAVDTWNGGSVKSHPLGTGVTYPAPGTEGYYDDGPREGDGTAQSTGDDGNPTNDYQLDGSNQLHCLSCHGVHFMDSNTLTVDQP